MAAKDTSHSPASHVAIIMDGNGRWAKGRGKPRLYGHKMGARRVREVVEACPDHGVRYLTLYAFSTENWKRAPSEVAGLMALFRQFIRSETAELVAQGVRVRFIGDRGPLNPKLRRMMAGLEEATACNGALNLTVALNYGARDELSRAALRLAQDVAAGRVSADAVGADSLRPYLDTADLPDPDLVIRTSGESRVSNFLLWQSAYSEFEFTPVYWPDFGRAELGRILARFGSRERRFGAVLS
nr:polyprenyl diphosphate synthase [Mangrovicoccus algicola]